MEGWVQAAESSIPALSLSLSPPSMLRNQTVDQAKESEKQFPLSGSEGRTERARVFASTITAEPRLSLWGFCSEQLQVYSE